jgi:hypothetical protein
METGLLGTFKKNSRHTALNNNLWSDSKFHYYDINSLPAMGKKGYQKGPILSILLNRFEFLFFVAPFYFL